LREVLQRGLWYIVTGITFLLRCFQKRGKLSIQGKQAAADAVDISEWLRGLSNARDCRCFGCQQRVSFIVAPDVLGGAALVAPGAADEATVRIRQGLAEWRRKGATFCLPFGALRPDF
jgi:hypothetical protein